MGRQDHISLGIDTGWVGVFPGIQDLTRLTSMSTLIKRQSQEISIIPRNRSALWWLFNQVGKALLDEIAGLDSGGERIVEDVKTTPNEGYWPKLHQTTRYLQQGGFVVNIWAWYEVINPRDGDMVGAGVSVVLGDISKTFHISGEDGDQQLSQVSAVGKNISQRQFEDWVALFELHLI